MPKVTDHELKKLQSKVSLSRIKPPFKDLQGVMRDANHLAKLVLRRHGYSDKTHMIDFQTGDIKEKVKK